DAYPDRDQAIAFLPWILTIARHKAIDFIRRSTRSRLRIQDPEALERLHDAAVELAPELERRQEAMRTCLEQVDDRGRQLLELHYSERLPLTDVAERLQLRLGAVKTALHRLRSRLRACIERRLRGDGP
ncbi:MAG: sigma-70 family RNA polymerase sigma factor, partial [Planctomycetota bacterium]